MTARDRAEEIVEFIQFDATPNYNRIRDEIQRHIQEAEKAMAEAMRAKLLESTLWLGRPSLDDIRQEIKDISPDSAAWLKAHDARVSEEVQRECENRLAVYAGVVKGLANWINRESPSLFGEMLAIIKQHDPKYTELFGVQEVASNCDQVSK